MYRTRTYLSAVLIILLLLSLYGCQLSPSKNIVTSKSDGSFDIKSIISETIHNEPDSTQPVTHADEFMSTDNSVHFTLEINETISNADMPVIEVVPHYLTEEDAERAAYALFEDAVFYEKEPAFCPTYSQSEIQEYLARWSCYTNREAVSNLFGSEITAIDDIVSCIKDTIEYYTEAFDNYPAEYTHVPCQWNFKKQSFYRYSTEEADKLNTSNETDVIEAEFTVDGIKYSYVASTRNQDDFKVNMISAYVYSSISPYLIDGKIFRAELCRTDEPTTDQIDAAREKAIAVLSKMELGEWLVDECYVDVKHYNGIPEYMIKISAVPIINGIPALRRPQISNLRSQDVYASNYYLTDALFEFSANAELVNFQLYSPIDVKSIINSNVRVMNMNDILERAKEFFKYSDYYQYGFGQIASRIDASITCNVHINELDYNLTRVKVPNSDDSYYYVPAVIFRGDIEYTNQETEEVYFSSENQTLLILNCVDGTIINSTNE